MVSLRMKLVIKALRKNKEKPKEQSVEAYRQGLESVIDSLPELAPEIERKTEQIGQVPGIWLQIKEACEDAVVLYFHGGGYIAGSASISEFFAAQFAQRVKIPFLLFDYGLAPERPFPSGLDDAVSVYRWLIETKGIKPNRIVFFGESAGGGLLISTLVRLRELDIDLPATAVCLSPWVDLALTGESMTAKEEIDPILSREEMEFLVKLYIGDNDSKDPLISPLYADLHDLPPLFIQVGSAEMILDDSLRIAKKAEEAGVDVTLDVGEGLPHVFALFFQYAPESKRAIERVCEYISRYIP